MLRRDNIRTSPVIMQGSFLFVSLLGMRACLIVVFSRVQYCAKRGWPMLSYWLE